MKGPNHITTSVGSVVAIDCGLRVLSEKLDNNWFHVYREFIFRTPGLPDDQIIAIAMHVVYFVAFIAAFLLGVLLPDIDQEHSALGRYIHIPVRHRTWTHTIWFVALFAVPAYFLPFFVWIAYGSLLHIFFDSLSRGGICWFYPISKYKTYEGGAQIKKKHWLWLYRVGDKSEKVFVIIFTILVVVGVACSIVFVNPLSSNANILHGLSLW